MRETERPQISYDTVAIRIILDEQAPEKPPTSAPRLNVDLSVAPAWRIKPMPVGRRRRRLEERRWNGDLDAIGRRKWMARSGGKPRSAARIAPHAVKESRQDLRRQPWRNRRRSRPPISQGTSYSAQLARLSKRFS
jgi:hypothetical protein